MTIEEQREFRKKWITELRAYPERQFTGELGRIREDGTIKACCLGQALICLNGIEKINVFNNKITDGVYTSSLKSSYEEFGLIDDVGSFNEPVFINDVYYSSLANMNDGNFKKTLDQGLADTDKDKIISWSEIADYIEQHPENIFKEV